MKIRWVLTELWIWAGVLLFLEHGVVVILLPNFAEITRDRPRQPAYEIKLILARISWALAHISCLLCGRPIRPSHYMSCPSVCSSVCLSVRPCRILTWKQRMISIRINVPGTRISDVLISGLPSVWGFPWGFPWVWVWYGYGDCDESQWVLWIICGDFWMDVTFCGIETNSTNSNFFFHNVFLPALSLLSTCIVK